LVTFAALVLAPLFIGLACRKRAEWRAIAPWSFVASGFQAVALPVFLAMYGKGSNGQGLVEIAEITAGVAWLAAVSYRLRSADPANGRPTPTRAEAHARRKSIGRSFKDKAPGSDDKGKRTGKAFSSPWRI
jgi:hypothetical protein